MRRYNGDLCRCGYDKILKHIILFVWRVTYSLNRKSERKRNDLQDVPLTRWKIVLTIKTWWVFFKFFYYIYIFFFFFIISSFEWIMNDDDNGLNKLSTNWWNLWWCWRMLYELLFSFITHSSASWNKLKIFYFLLFWNDYGHS